MNRDIELRLIARRAVKLAIDDFRIISGGRSKLDQGRVVQPMRKKRACNQPTVPACVEDEPAIFARHENAGWLDVDTDKALHEPVDSQVMKRSSVVIRERMS